MGAPQKWAYNGRFDEKAKRDSNVDGSVAYLAVRRRHPAASFSAASFCIRKEANRSCYTNWTAGECEHLSTWSTIDAQMRKEREIAMRTALLYRLLCAEEIQQHLSVQPLFVWEQRPIVRAVQTGQQANGSTLEVLMQRTF
ncbi:hypothetical protein AAES_44913 [Amazona aestiva]|uniref:Uncharacterized protein n=1 Tax=Amazona aestiva TaxID=12930 RepID=A0A0Q3UTX6_AMAAE|nr:hypothetical protein AAES_44913 [Amazona aestiva]